MVRRNSSTGHVQMRKPPGADGREPGPRVSWQRVVIDGLEAGGYVTRHRGTDHVEFRCPVPAHEDSKPSGTADYNAADGRTLVRCHGGCATEDVVAAIGCTMADLFDYPADPDGRRPSPRRLRLARPAEPGESAPKCAHRWVKQAEHPYTDADGVLVRRVIRKRCSRCQLKDIRPSKTWDPADRVLYRLPEVLAAVADGRTIYLNEGEGCADAMAALGLSATTNPFGADDGTGGKWLPAYTEVLRSAARVVIVADNDVKGYRHAAYVREQLEAAGVPVGVVRAAVAAPKADIIEHLEAGGTPDTLIPVDPAAMLAELDGAAHDGEDQVPEDVRARRLLGLGITAPPGQRIPIDPRDLPPEISLLDARRLDPGPWPHVVPELLPIGAGVIFARPGAAKTTLSDQLEHCGAARVPIAGYAPADRFRSLVIDYEGGPALAIERSHRIAAFGQLVTDQTGDPEEMILLFHEWPGLTFETRMAELEKRLRDADHDGRPFGLVRIDTMRAFLGSPPLGMNAYQYDIQCLIRVNQLARDLGACILLIHHPNKAGEVSGSVGIEGSVTFVYKIERKPGESEGLLRCVKNRVGRERSWALEFDLAAGTWSFSDTITPGQAAHTGAKRAIIDLLTENGPAMGPDILAALPGVKDSTLKPALSRLHRDGWVIRSADGVWSLTAAAGTRAAEPPAVPDGDGEAGQLCALCGESMIVIIPGQTMHPMCGPLPGEIPEPPADGPPTPADPARADVEDRAAEPEPADTCGVCGDPRTVADTHPDCTEAETRAARWPGIQAMKASFAHSRMHPIPWIGPPGHPAVKPGMQTRDLTQWRAAEQADIGAFRWHRPGLLEEFGPDALVITTDRNQSYVSATSSVPVAPNTLVRYGPLEVSPKQLGKPDPRTGKPTGLAGVVRLVAPEWEHGAIAHPIGRNARPGKPIVIASGMLEDLWRLHEQGLIARPEVLDSYLGRRNQSLFEDFGRAVREARAKHATDPVMSAAVKRSSSIAIRKLYPKAASSPFWRPDWYAAIVSQAMFRLWVRAWQAVQAGAVVAGMGSVDETAFIVPGDIADPASWVPEPFKLGTGWGEVKHKPIQVRADRADLAGIDPGQITPAKRAGDVSISGPVPLRVWVMRRA